MKRYYISKVRNRRGKKIDTPEEFNIIVILLFLNPSTKG